MRDDYGFPEKLGRVYEEFKRHPEVGMVYHRHTCERGGGHFRDGYFIPVSGTVPRAGAHCSYPMVGTSC